MQEPESITITNFIADDGSIKDKRDSCYDELRRRYADFNIFLNAQNAIVLTLSDKINGMPYLNKVEVGFQPTVAILNRTEKGTLASGTVQVNNGQESAISDGKEGNRYSEQILYATANPGSMIDLSTIMIGNVNAVNTISTRMDGVNEIISLDANNNFTIQLPYFMANKSDDYTVYGNIEIERVDRYGNPIKIKISMNELPLPVDVGVSFTPAKVVDNGNNENSNHNQQNQITISENGLLEVNKEKEFDQSGVKTGDDTPIGLLIAMMLTAFCVAIIGFFKRKEIDEK